MLLNERRYQRHRLYSIKEIKGTDRNHVSHWSSFEFSSSYQVPTVVLTQCWELSIHFWWRLCYQVFPGSVTVLQGKWAQGTADPEGQHLEVPPGLQLGVKVTHMKMRDTVGTWNLHKHKETKSVCTQEMTGILWGLQETGGPRVRSRETRGRNSQPVYFFFLF